ncbi:extensin-like [Quercus suber]|uniref:Uncharacterized protein n=1 Tax=Quercus suber TaxID=58331 RepID=A0AAW0L3H7_QUESU
MATNSNQALLSTLFLALIFLNFPAAIRPDNACPYPCYPPPTGPGNTPTTPAATTPPPPFQIESYPPPAGNNPTTPTGNLPFDTPPPPFGSNSAGAPPPPDPILPYFPFYYREPLHGEGQASATTLGRPIWIMMAMAKLLVFIFLFSSYV